MSKTTHNKRVMLLGDGRQVHTARWGDYLESVGYDVLTVSLEPLTEIAGAGERVTVAESLPDFVRYPLAVSAVKRIAGDFKPDVVNAHFLPNYGVIAAMAGFDNWVLSTWGSDIMMLPQKSAFHMWRTRAVISRATYITSDADVMTERLIELGAPPDRVLTFPFGVDRAKFYAADASAASGPRVLSNRKLEAVYDIGTVLKGFARARGQLADATLTVGGSGSLEQSLRAAVPAEVSDAVQFVGNTAHDQMPDQLRAHDIFVSMSLSDTTSVSLLEAMACGLYPIVSDIPANREWIEAGVNGDLVPVRDDARLAQAIVAAWGDDSRRARARENNLQAVAQRADWAENMRVVKELFDRLSGRTDPIPA